MFNAKPDRDWCRTRTDPIRTKEIMDARALLICVLTSAHASLAMGDAWIELDIKNEIDLKDGSYLAKDIGAEHRYGLVTHSHGRFEQGDIARALCGDGSMVSDLPPKFGRLKEVLKPTDFVLTRCEAETEIPRSPSFKPFAVFLGDGRALPRALSWQPCNLGRPRDGWRAQTLVDDEVLEGCWAWSKDARLGPPNSVIEICRRKNYTIASGPMDPNSCSWISKDMFIDPSSLPRRAF